jgi:hypothetical protein
MRASGELGSDVTVRAERGERAFAPGDRLMFLRNERGLRVKNGTLGIVEQVTPQTMAVRTDDGRAVTFDIKDYAHVDHGYAATIHKAQGMTVDRTHAGTRLMRSESPQALNALERAADLLRDNREAIEACQKSAANAKQPVLCTVRIRAGSESRN